MKKVLLLNICLLIFFAFSCRLYNHRQVIMNTEKPITNYSVLEVNHHSNRMSSTILVEYNGKEYYIGVNSEQCKSLNIKLFYDKDRDEVFEQKEIHARGLTALFVILLCSVVWLLVIIWKKRELLKPNKP